MRTPLPVLLLASPAAGYFVDVGGISTPRTLKSEIFDMRRLAGVSAPLGFFDPLALSKSVPEGRARFYREVELKHGRIAMLASAGFVVAERFHPLFGGDNDLPSYVAFQATPLQASWIAVLAVIMVLELSSVASFETPLPPFDAWSYKLGLGGSPWSVRRDHTPGDLGWDPLSLKPTSAAELLEMQTMEINHGRAAMIGISGMVAQEVVTGVKLFS